VGVGGLLPSGKHLIRTSAVSTQCWAGRIPAIVAAALGEPSLGDPASDPLGDVDGDLLAIAGALAVGDAWSVILYQIGSRK